VALATFLLAVYAATGEACIRFHRSTLKRIRARCEPLPRCNFIQVKIGIYSNSDNDAVNIDLETRVFYVSVHFLGCIRHMENRGKEQ
jgi:hypothetical protein